MAIPTSIKTLLSGDVVEWARIEIVSFLGTGSFGYTGRFKTIQGIKPQI